MGNQGDLISREALLKAMEEERQYLLARGQTGAEHILVHHCLPIIDNAPTVKITEEQAIDKLHETGWLPRHDKEMTERPQGKWTDLSTDGRHVGWIACSVCGQEPPNDSNLRTDFCPNCGADMRGGAEE